MVIRIVEIKIQLRFRVIWTLFYIFQGLICGDNKNTTLIIPSSKYAPFYSGSTFGGLLPAEIASLSSTMPFPFAPPPNIMALINSLSTSKTVQPSLPVSLVNNFMKELTSSPVLLQSVEPSAIVPLVSNMCSSTSPLNSTPNSTAVDFITAIALNPKTMNALPPSTTVCLLSKTDLVCSLSSAVRTAMLHSVSSLEVLAALKPKEISILVDVYLSDQCVLAESPATDITELLRTISSSQDLIEKVSTDRIVKLLYQLSKLAPSTFCAIPIDVINALLGPIAVSADLVQSADMFTNLTAVLTSSPYIFTTIDPSIISTLLDALSSSDLLRAVLPTTVVKLLTDLSLSIELLKTVSSESIIGILHSIKCVSPQLLCDIPSSVRSAFVSYLTTAEVTKTLSVETFVKLIDTLSYTPCLLAELSSSSLSTFIAFVVSNENLLNAVPPNNIINLIYNLTNLSSSSLRELPPDHIAKLLSLLQDPTTISLSPVCYAKLLSSLAYSPFLLNAISDTEIISVFTALNSSPKIFEEIPSKVIVIVLTQIFTSPQLLSKIPFGLILNLLINIEKQSPKVISTIPPFAISALIDFLGTDPATSLPPDDVTNLVYILAKEPCMITQVSVKTLFNLFEAIATSSTISKSIPVDIKIKLIYNTLYALSPSIFCALSPTSIREITNSFSSSDVLGNLSSNSLIELTTSVSECPCLLMAVDFQTLINLLDVLSASPSTLKVLKPSTVINLLTSLSSSDSSAAIPISTYLRFLRALSDIAPSTLCLIPTSVFTVLLKPLKSLDEIKKLSSIDIENLLDVLIVTPCMLGELPRAILVNLMTAISTVFTTIPPTKVITLLTCIHSVSPSLICIVPVTTISDLLNLFSSQSVLNALPSEHIVALTLMLASSPCLLKSLPAATLNSLLSLLSSSPKLFKVIPFVVTENFLTKLSLTQAALEKVNLSVFISFISALFTAFQSSACNLPPTVLHALFVSLCNAKTINELEEMDLVSLLNVFTSVPYVLNAISGSTLDTLMSKIAASPSFLTITSPKLLTSFFTVLTSSPTALNTIQPMTIVNLLVTIALAQPSVLSVLPPTVVSTIWNMFNSQKVFASLPPPVINSLISLLMTSPNLLAALPLSTLNRLLCFLTSSPKILGSLPSCTLVRFLTVMSSLPPVLKALSPGLITSFISALSIESPKFLCILPPSVINGLISSVISPSALTTATPASIASIVTTLNRSSCLITVLPMPLLISFVTYLTSHQNLLSSTPRSEILNLIYNIQYPDSIPRVVASGSSCVAANNFEDFSSFRTQSPAISIENVDKNSLSTTTSFPQVILPENNNLGAKIYTFIKNNKENNLNETIPEQ